ncbi:MAG: Ribosomal RNA-processing protein 7 [Caeruleum heppii]|nr:MAG: Ribosomal RNA-processing protein 7 [Caeruleum heppii]
MGEVKGPTAIAGYAILALELEPLPALKQSATHYLYLERHEPRISTPDDARTLFAVNVPIDATESHFRCLFAQMGEGRVDTVKFEGKRSVSKPAVAPVVTPKNRPNRKRKREEAITDMSAAEELPQVWDRDLHQSGSTALIVFVDQSSLEATMKAIKRRGGKPVPWGVGVQDRVAPLGSQRYLNHHRLRYPPTLTLQASVDAYMTQYASLEAQHKRQAAQLRQEPDADGFVTVSRGGRTGPARQEEAQAAADKQKQKEGLKDFYRFQMREERKKKHGELLKRFEQDRRKVDEMKRKRGRFKPE